MPDPTPADPTLTGKGDPNAPGSQERMAVKALLDDVEALKTGNSDMSTTLKGLQDTVKGFEDIDIPAAIKLLEEHRGAIEEIREGIKSSKDGMWFPGVEDEAKNFSLLKTAIAHKGGGDKAAFEKAGAGHEFEIIKAAKEAAEQRGAGHVIGIDASAGTFVPDQVIPDVIQAIYTRSVIANVAGADGQTRATVLDGLFGVPVKIPRSFNGMTAYWIGEEDEYIQSKIAVGTETMSPKKLGVFAGVTDEMRRFTAPAFETMMRNDMARAAAKKIDWTAMYGTGTDDMPLGIANMKIHGDGFAGGAGLDKAGNLAPGVNWYWFQDDIPSWERTSLPGASSADFEFTFDGLMNMMGILEDIDLDIDDSFAWISHPRAWRRLRQLKVEHFSGQTSGFAYLLGSPMVTEQRLADLIGEFDKTTQIPTTKDPDGTAGAFYGDLFAGNWREFLMGRWSGVEIEDDEGKGAGFSRDITWIKFRLHMDFGHREERALLYSPDVRMRES